MNRLLLSAGISLSLALFTACDRDDDTPRVKPAPGSETVLFKEKKTTVIEDQPVLHERREETQVTEKVETVPVPVPSPGGNPDYAIKADGKPGFVRSPYTKDDRLIDVRGLPPGTEAQDPYTGRTFLVP